jgi:hypothetical protein
MEESHMIEAKQLFRACNSDLLTGTLWPQPKLRLNADGNYTVCKYIVKCNGTFTVYMYILYL